MYIKVFNKLLCAPRMLIIFFIVNICFILFQRGFKLKEIDVEL